MPRIISIPFLLALCALGFYFHFVHRMYEEALQEKALFAPEPVACCGTVGGGLSPSLSETAKEGRTLFLKNCSACHAVNRILVGPALAGVQAKYAGQEEWLYQWIRNSQGLIKAGDERAVALYEANNRSAMTSFPTLTDEEIVLMLEYIEAAGQPVY